MIGNTVAWGKIISSASLPMARQFYIDKLYWFGVHFVAAI